MALAATISPKLRVIDRIPSSVPTGRLLVVWSALIMLAFTAPPVDARVAPRKPPRTDMSRLTRRVRLVGSEAKQRLGIYRRALRSARDPVDRARGIPEKARKTTLSYIAAIDKVMAEFDHPSVVSWFDAWSNAYFRVGNRELMLNSARYGDDTIWLFEAKLNEPEKPTATRSLLLGYARQDAALNEVSVARTVHRRVPAEPPIDTHETPRNAQPEHQQSTQPATTFRQYEQYVAMPDLGGWLERSRRDRKGFFWPKGTQTPIPITDVHGFFSQAVAAEKDRQLLEVGENGSLNPIVAEAF